MLKNEKRGNPRFYLKNSHQMPTMMNPAQIRSSSFASLTISNSIYRPFDRSPADRVIK
ncbi:hypothetical protein [Edaphobacillus lindanitolerans]|uniref:hypothetical protein n=1 Tax=Edaphobacillus lindanitolerans TaxID=550447 RepID=UPI0013566D4C|nr:hypothetical protein [Edaphobacillus lindanitolerans]